MCQCRGSNSLRVLVSRKLGTGSSLTAQITYALARLIGKGNLFEASFCIRRSTASRNAFFCVVSQRSIYMIHSTYRICSLFRTFKYLLLIQMIYFFILFSPKVCVLKNCYTGEFYVSKKNSRELNFVLLHSHPENFRATSSIAS